MRHHPVGFLPLCLAILCERCAAYMLASSLVLIGLGIYFHSTPASTTAPGR